MTRSSLGSCRPAVGPRARAVRPAYVHGVTKTRRASLTDTVVSASQSAAGQQSNICGRVPIALSLSYIPTTYFVLGVARVRAPRESDRAWVSVHITFQVEIFRPKMGQIGGQVRPLAIYEHPRVSPTPQ